MSTNTSLSPSLLNQLVHRERAQHAAVSITNERKVVPFAVKRSLEDVTLSLQYLFITHDSGERERDAIESWKPDTEPVRSPIDSWSRNSVRTISSLPSIIYNAQSQQKTSKPIRIASEQQPHISSSPVSYSAAGSPSVSRSVSPTKVRSLPSLRRSSAPPSGKRPVNVKEEENKDEAGGGKGGGDKEPQRPVTGEKEVKKKRALSATKLKKKQEITEKQQTKPNQQAKNSIVPIDPEKLPTHCVPISVTVKDSLPSLTPSSSPHVQKIISFDVLKQYSFKLNNKVDGTKLPIIEIKN